MVCVCLLMCSYPVGGIWPPPLLTEWLSSLLVCVWVFWCVFASSVHLLSENMTSSVIPVQNLTSTMLVTLESAQLLCWFGSSSYLLYRGFGNV